jgi:hypothetical protein
MKFIIIDCSNTLQIIPSSYIQKSINSISYKIKFKTDNFNYNPTPENRQFFFKKTFFSKKKIILGDKVSIAFLKNCLKCKNIINLLNISKDFESVQKDEIFWMLCPNCKKVFIPELEILVGNNINDYYIKSKFILQSPYQLKYNTIKIVEQDEHQIFHLENLHDDYPNIFWSIIWYFYLYNLGLDIILPYDFLETKEMNAYSVTNTSSRIKKGMIEDIKLNKIIGIKNKKKNQIHN